MLRTLVALARSAELLEFVSAGVLIAGVAVLWGLGAALVVGGVCGVLKAFAMDAPS